LIDLLRNKVELKGSSAVKIDLAGLDPRTRSAVAEILITRRTLSEDAARFLEDIALSDRETPALRARVVAGLKERHRSSAIRVQAAIGQQEILRPELLAAWRDYLGDEGHARPSPSSAGWPRIPTRPDASWLMPCC
jgi:hypothetical protein